MTSSYTEVGNPKVVVLLSGGMDSTTLLYHMIDQQYEPVALSIHYGQRHAIELYYAKTLTHDLGIRHEVLDLMNLRELLRGSSLTSDIPVPEGHYAADNMAATVVPNRNAILLAIAYGFATSIKAKKVCTAVHAGDHAIYPDCRPEFIKAFEDMERTAITREIYGISSPSMYAPFLHLSKAGIAALGDTLKVPWSRTWSCYQGSKTGEVTSHCGRCGTCVERIWALHEAGIDDPTEYQDKEYAKGLLQERGEWK